MHWKLKVLTYIESESLIKLFIKDGNFFNKIINKIFNEYYQIFDKKIESSNSILDLINIYPQISKLKVNHLPIKNEIVKISNNYLQKPSNRYILVGEKNDYFIYSDIVLPHPKNSSIPFTIGIVKNDKFKLINSNIFYFEVNINMHNFRLPDFEESLLIGFTNADKPDSKNSFGFGKTFGLNVFNNRFEIDGEIVNLPFEIYKGDTIGLGLKYLDKFKYELFFTCNGKIVKINFNQLNILNLKCYLKVIINLNLASGIDVNFGNEEFLFDIEKINFCPKIINLSTNNLINNGFSFDKIDSDSVCIKSNYTEYIYNLLNTNITAAF